MQRGPLSLSLIQTSFDVLNTSNGPTYRSSLLASVLPSNLKHRIPPIRLLRELAKTYMRPSLHQHNTSDYSDYSDYSDSSIPPPYLLRRRPTEKQLRQMTTTWIQISHPHRAVDRRLLAQPRPS